MKRDEPQRALELLEHVVELEEKQRQQDASAEFKWSAARPPQPMWSRPPLAPLALRLAARGIA